MAETGKGAPRIAPHPLVEALNPDPTKPPRRTVKLFGLPGPSPDAKQTRLWLDTDLSSYVDVPNDAILHSRTLPDDAGTVLWVAADAQLTHGSVTSHETQASFLTGDIASSHLGGTPGPGGPIAQGFLPPTAPPICPSGFAPCQSHTGPCVSLQICMSETMPPTHCGPCLSHVTCPSRMPCVTETCPPSHLGPCHSSPIACPPQTVMGPCLASWIWVCQPTFVGCAPSVHTVCPPSTQTHCPPSVHTICPTPPVSFDLCPRPSALQMMCPTPSAVDGCPSIAGDVCPRPSAQFVCPTPSAVGGCPSVACGGQAGGGGPVAQ